MNVFSSVLFITRTHNIINDRCLVIVKAYNDFYRCQCKRKGERIEAKLRRSRYTESNWIAWIFKHTKGIELATPIPKMEGKSRQYLNEIHFWHETIIISKNDKWMHTVWQCSAFRGLKQQFLRAYCENTWMKLTQFLYLIGDAAPLCVIVIVETRTSAKKKKSLHRNQTRVPKCVSTGGHHAFSFSLITNSYLLCAFVYNRKITGGRSSCVV